MAKKPYTADEIEPGVKVFSSPDEAVRMKLLKVPNETFEKYALDPQPGETMHRRGGMVKKGSSTVPKMCAGGKVIKTWR